MFRQLVPIRSKFKKIVYGMSEILFAAEIAFCRLNRGMPQQELDLLQLATVRVAELRTGPTQIMRCNMLQTSSLATTFDYIPHDILRDAFPPHLSRSGNPPKDPSLCDSGCHCPLIERRFDPFRDRHGADVATLADEVHYCPVPLTHLDLIQFQANKFRSAKTTTKQQSQHGIVALGSHAISARTLEYFRTLLRAQPVAGAKSELLDSFHSADSRCQLGTQQT